ncbi:MAG: hypothetical protein ACOCUF_02070 [Patescibacteria group bacterium]
MKKRILFLVVFAFLFLGAFQAQASSKTTVYFFWGEGCPHCAEEKPFLEEMEEKYPELEVKMLETYKDKENSELFQEMAAAYGTQARGVPVTFIGDHEPIIGFSGSMEPEIESKIKTCLEEGCVDPEEKAGVAKKAEEASSGGGESSTEQKMSVAPEKEDRKESAPQSSDFTSEDKQGISLPLVGNVNFSEVPLFVSTGLIAFVDGFNPCSLWLISFLLGIVIYTGSRKKIFLVGTTFLLVTTIAYGFFMAGLLNVFMYIGYLTWIQVGVALIALIFAVVNIKDYFWYKKGLSFTISDKYKPKIFKNVRSIMKGERSTWSMMAGTAGLALGVVLIELPCTAGFPVIWTNLLAQYDVSTVTFLLLLLLYLLIYMLDEMIVVGGAVLTLKAGKFEEKHGRMLKLIGGVIMLSLASVMLVDPDLMNEIGTSVLIFAGSIAVSFLIMFIHRKILPKFDVKIGTEKNLAPEEEEQNETNRDEKS